MSLLRILAIGAAVAALLAGALMALAAMARTATDAWGRAYVLDDLQRLPKVDTVLVLGAGPPDQHLSQRIDAAAGLWHAGHADRFLVSGIQATITRDELVARGVPATVIELDPGGVDTWNSVARARHVFGKQRLLIVSQRDHLGPALFLARHIGIEAWGVAARGVTDDGFYGGLRAYYDVLSRPAPAIIAAVRPR
jgi:vancomycin permeability regulator SanA